MSKFKAYGNWVALKTVFREEHVSEAGIMYKDILEGDHVYWKYGADPGCFYKQGDDSLDLVQSQNLLAVKRPDEAK